jgi:hypothetical protein
LIDCRQFVSRRELYDEGSTVEHKGVWHQDHAASRLTPERGDDRCHLGVAMSGRHDWLDLEVSCGGFE